MRLSGGKTFMIQVHIQCKYKWNFGAKSVVFCYRAKRTHAHLTYTLTFTVKIKAITSFNSKLICNRPDISTHALAVFIGPRTRQ